MREFIEKFDNTVSAEQFYKQHGADLFVKFFRCYSLEHPRLNLDYNFEVLESSVEIEDPCEAINRRVDNIEIKIIRYCD